MSKNIMVAAEIDFHAHGIYGESHTNPKRIRRSKNNSPLTRHLEFVQPYTRFFDNRKAHRQHGRRRHHPRAPPSPTIRIIYAL